MSSGELDAMEVKSRLKIVARASEDRTTNVVFKELNDVTDDVIQNLPRERSLNRIVQRERLSVIPGFVPSVPEIPECLWNNNRGEIFFRSDSGVNDVSRHVIFKSDLQLNVLKESETWIVDGTFKSVPGYFDQLVTIQGKHLGRFWPCLHALLITRG